MRLAVSDVATRIILLLDGVLDETTVVLYRAARVGLSLEQVAPDPPSGALCS